jgi:hypothetical protein
MSSHTSLGSLFSHIEARINWALGDEVMDAVRKAEAKAIDAEVYSVYSPSVYVRRGESKGLGDPRNIRMAEKPSNGVLVVVNETKPNPNPFKSDSMEKNLPELVEYGHGNRWMYDYPRDGLAYMEPRPFTARTASDLRASRDHVEALRRGLIRRGMSVR